MRGGAADGRRRRRRIVTAGIAGVAVLGLAVPSVLDAVTPEDVPVAATGPVAPPDDNLYDGPTRGSLRDDAAFVEAVRALPWPGTTGGPGPGPADRHVVFAGDVPAGRWALVVARPAVGTADAAFPGGLGPDLLDSMWFTGPPGAPAAQLTPAIDPVIIKPSWPTELLDPATGVLVVVAAVGDEIELSERPEIAADGSVSRDFSTIGTTDGVAVVQLGTAGVPYGTASMYRIVRNPADTAIRPWTTVPAGPGLQPAIEYPRGEPGEPGRTAAVHAAHRVLGEIGLPPDEVEVSAQWVGDVPARGPGQAAVVTVTLPNGAVVVDGQWQLPPRAGAPVQGSDCGRTVLPAGAPAARRVYALVCEVVDETTGAPMQTTLVVVAPPDVVLVRTYDGNGAFLSEHPAHEGVAVARRPIGAHEVEAVTDGGVSLGRTEILGDTASFGD
ncbi:MAG: hypothetical protein ABWY29_06950 [Blastococcus sp.]